MKYKVKIDDQVFNVEILDLHARPVVAFVNGQLFEVWPEDDTPLSRPAKPTGQTSPIPHVTVAQPTLTISHTASGNCEVRAPIPGVIVSIAVEIGDNVDVGQELLVIEAMKMKNTIRSPRQGVIEKISITPGQTVKHQDMLLSYSQ